MVLEIRGSRRHPGCFFACRFLTIIPLMEDFKEFLRLHSALFVIGKINGNSWSLGKLPLQVCLIPVFCIFQVLGHEAGIFRVLDIHDIIAFCYKVVCQCIQVLLFCICCNFYVFHII